jgi:hypothetical protein
VPACAITRTNLVQVYWSIFMNAITNTNTSAAPSLTWATKAGALREAHGAVGQALAPRAARMSSAHANAVSALMGGQYRPTLRDAIASLTGAKLEGLRASVREALSTTTPEGVTLVPSFAGNDLPANKRVMLAVAEWAMSPTSSNKKGIAPFEFTKNQLALFAPITEWASLTSEADHA